VCGNVRGSSEKGVILLRCVCLCEDKIRTKLSQVTKTDNNVCHYNTQGSFAATGG